MCRVRGGPIGSLEAPGLKAASQVHFSPVLMVLAEPEQEAPVHRLAGSGRRTLA